MPYILNLVYGLFLLATLPFWILKALRTGKYREGLWRKLVGAPPAVDNTRGVVWIHAVSVGEVNLLKPLLARWQQRRPDFQIVLSTSTNTGYAVAVERYPTIKVFYAPLDFTWSVRRVLGGLRPSLLVLTELELWPNLIREARRLGIPIAVANARMSPRSYRRYRRVRPLLRSVFNSVAWWGAQSDDYADRLRQLVGPHGGVIERTGSMKYDGASSDRNQPATQALRDLFGFHGRRTVWVAGSTQAPEEEIVLAAFRELRPAFPSLHLIVVPRHRERFHEVAELLQRSGFSFVRRSAVARPLAHPPEVVLIDTMGELAAIWGLADIGFVGGSLDGKRGGQSMIEPAGYGVPTCFGPHVWNFADTAAKLLQVDGAVQLRDAGELVAVVRGWLEDPGSAKDMGRRARDFVASQQGSVEATFQALERLLPSSPKQRASA